jgi:phage/plasmid-associated DNA primase
VHGPPRKSLTAGSQMVFFKSFFRMGAPLYFLLEDSAILLYRAGTGRRDTKSRYIVMSGNVARPGKNPSVQSSGGAKVEVPLPTPAETEALAREELQKVEQRQQYTEVRELSAFLRGQTQKITGRGDEKTNIIDQGERVTYSFPADTVHDLFQHLEKLRRMGLTTHFSERQGTPASPMTGLMLDYDLFVSDPNVRLNDRHVHKIACRIVRALRRDLIFPAKARRNGTETVVHVFSIVKPKPVAVDDETGNTKYKYGFHLLLPGVRTSRGYKKHLLRDLRDDSAIKGVLTDLKVVGDPVECLDMNSASVPVLFLGSCKRGGSPYAAGPAFEISFEAAFASESGKTPGALGDDFYPMVKVVSAKSLETKGYNLVAELSLCYEARYEQNKPPLVESWVCPHRPELDSKIALVSNQTQDSEELLLAQHSLSTLAVHDAEARYLHQILDILDKSYYTDRNKWRNVVFALANTSPTYKPLAEWFSHKYYKWADKSSKRLDNFDQMWDDAVARRGSVKNPITRRSLIRWAQLSNPQKFKQVSDQGYFATLANYVYGYGGVIEHYMVAKVLHAMLGNKFVVDVDEGHRGRYTYCWFEFVVPGQASQPGEPWKWRKEIEPDELHKYISENLIKVFDRVAQDIEDRRKRATEEGKAKYYQKLGATFRLSQRKIFNDTFKNGIIRQANYLFRRRGFVASLDKDPDLLGTGNGLLRLGAKCTLIDHFHEHAVMKYTPVVYKPFNPSDPWTKLLLQAFEDIIPEDDIRDWILFDAATSLSGGVKEGILLLWYGGGANGKTFVMRMISKTLGAYSKKLNISLLTSEREPADRSNSAAMQLKGIRNGYFEETQKSGPLNDQRLKEIVNPGEMSGREMYGKQENFELTATLMVGQNFDFIVKTYDHGTWRRLKHYTAKVKFCSDPDPDNPFEKKDNPKFIREYVNDPDCQTAMLSILVHYYERLQREYGGQVKNVPCPTLKQESQVFRNSQDMINRFITEMVVYSPDSKYVYPLASVATSYVEWYNMNVDRRRHVASEIIQDLENSALRKYLKRAPNKTLVLHNCRILTKESPMLGPKETFLGAGEDTTTYTRKSVTGGTRKKNSDWWGATPGQTRKGEKTSPRALRNNNLFTGDFDSYAAVLPEPSRGSPTPEKDEKEISDEALEGLLTSAAVINNSAPSFTIADLYGD